MTSVEYLPLCDDVFYNDKLNRPQYIKIKFSGKYMRWK